MPQYTIQRGTYDAYDDDALNLQNIEDVLSSMALSYGYNQIRTPLYEDVNLFTRTAGESSDIVTKEMFDFEDKGGRHIALRPEVTAGVIRAVVSNKLYATKDLPIKFFYKGPAFRYERPQAGRYRQFTQFGVECVGVNSYLHDVETIALGYNSLITLGFPHVILKINTLGDEESRNNYKVALKEYFSDKITCMCSDCQRRYEQNILRILDCKVEDDRKIIANAPKMSDYLNESSREYFKKVLALLDEMSIPYEIDDTLVRGLDYYSHVVFEYHFIKEDGTSLGAIGAGGHYDKLVADCGGPQLSSVGFAIGEERVNTLLKDLHPEEYAKPSIDVYTMHIGEETLEHAYLLSEELRNEDIKVDMTFENKNMGAQFKLAARKNARYALIVGEEEMKNYKYKVKDLQSQEQVEVDYQDLINYFVEKVFLEEDEGEN